MAPSSNRSRRPASQAGNVGSSPAGVRKISVITFTWYLLFELKLTPSISWGHLREWLLPN